MRDKLIELIFDSAKLWRYPVGNSYLFDYGKLADHLIANGVTFAEDNNVLSWIPVSERLPFDGVSIEMFFPVSQTICLGYYRKIAKTDFWCVSFPDGTGRVADDKPTHWRYRYIKEEIPPLPKGEDNETD